MISFIRTVKSSAATEHLLKLEALGFIFCSPLRSLSTNNYLISQSLHKRNINTINTNKCHYSSKKPKQLGRIVDLGEDFHGLEVGVNVIEARSRSKIINDAIKTGEEAVEEEVEKEEQEQEETSSNLRKKFIGRCNFKDMDRNSILLSSIMSKLKNKKQKEKHKEIILEGKRLIHEAVTAGLKPLKIFFTRSSDLLNLNLPDGTETYRVPYKACKLWGDVETPQGVIGIFQMPNPNMLEKRADSLPLTIICDNVRDPGNMGSILRIVASVGCEKLILTSGCTGVWEQKVIRAGAGAHFVFPIATNSAWTEIENLIDDNCEVFLAHGHFQSKCESEEATRSNFKNFNEIIAKDLPITSYYSVEFENKSTVIVIGGETHGLSNEAYEFAQKRNATRVFIPMANKIESLNCSVALAVLAFEYRRQIVQMKKNLSCS